MNHHRDLGPLGRTLLWTMIFSGQTCVSSHRAFWMSLALVPFLVPQIMRWDLGEGVVVVEVEWLTWSEGLGVLEDEDWRSFSD